MTNKEMSRNFITKNDNYNYQENECYFFLFSYTNEKIARILFCNLELSPQYVNASSQVI